ncbi:hypothetical protein OROHE_005561 [Orobanche hederae]
MLRRLGSTLQRCRVSDVLFSLQGKLQRFHQITKKRLDQHNQLHEDIKMKFLQKVRERNAYYNKVLELKVDVSEETSPLAMSVLDGYNVCIFAYGQTGTGKNFTMEGTDEVRGVTYRTLQRLFDIIEEFRRPLISKLQRMAN